MYIYVYWYFILLQENFNLHLIAIGINYIVICTFAIWRFVKFYC